MKKNNNKILGLLVLLLALSFGVSLAIIGISPPPHMGGSSGGS
ncbi:MAG: hypothetical protein ACTSWY_13965 [Promethearchaeota archaeon]